MTRSANVLSALNESAGFRLKFEMYPGPSERYASTPNAIYQLEKYLETQAKESFENWLEDAKLVSHLQDASQFCFQKGCYSQERLMAIIQKHHLLPHVEKDNLSWEKTLVLLWRQEKIFRQHSSFISEFLAKIIDFSVKPYPIIQTLLEIKDEKALTAVWCGKSISNSDNFLEIIIRRICESSIDFQEAYSSIELLLQKGYLNCNDSQMRASIKFQLRKTMTELCRLVADSAACYYAQSILSLLKVNKSFNVPATKIRDWQDNLFEKYQNTDQVEFKIGLSDLASMIPKPLDFPQIQSMMAARLIIMASLQPFFPEVLIGLVKRYLNLPPLEIKTVPQGQIFFTQKKQDKDSGSSRTHSQHLLPKSSF